MDLNNPKIDTEFLRPPYFAWISVKNQEACISDQIGCLPSIDEIFLLQRELNRLRRLGQSFISKSNKEKQEEYSKPYTGPLPTYKSQTQESKKQEGYIYLLKCNNLYKIGITRTNPQNRLSTYQTENPFDKTVLLCEYCFDYINKEDKIKKLFSNKLKKGKEWFDLSDKDIITITNLILSNTNEITAV